MAEVSQEAKGAYSTVASGSTVRSLYVEREVKVFAVQENEFNSLSNMSTFATLMYTLASVLFAYAISIWSNAVFYDKLTPAGIVATKFIAPGLVLLGLVFLVAAITATVKRSGLWRTIKRESRS